MLQISRSSTPTANTAAGHSNGSRQARRLVLVLLAGLSLAPLPGLAKISALTKLTVIGDSYSDSGNSGLLTNGVVPPNGYPPAPYAGGRFSNGPVAVEQLWQLFNPAQPPLLPSLAGGSNHAVGGATSGRDNYEQVSPDVPPGFGNLYQNTSAAAQLPAALASGPFDPASTLFTVWLGGNDGLYWLQTSVFPGVGFTPGTIQGGPPALATPSQLIANAIGNVGFAVQNLINAGAQHLLVPNQLDFGQAPAFNNDPVLAPLISTLVGGFNGELNNLLQQLRTANPSVDIMGFDMAGLFNSIRSTPAAYGFSNVADSCLNALSVNPACDPNSWFFWDGVHPTTYAHQVIAGAMAQTVRQPASVPGPLPLAGGIAAFGWARTLRRRRSSALVAQTRR